MKKMTFPAIAAAALFVAAPALASAQAPQPAPPSPTQAPAPASQEPRAARAEKAQGELVKVDVDAKTITIKSADGVETQFAYTEATDVGGARDGVAGLATKAGSKVTVHFTSDMGKKVATKIETSEKK